MARLDKQLLPAGQTTRVALSSAEPPIVVNGERENRNTWAEEKTGARRTMAVKVRLQEASAMERVTVKPIFIAWM